MVWEGSAPRREFWPQTKFGPKCAPIIAHSALDLHNSSAPKPVTGCCNIDVLSISYTQGRRANKSCGGHQSPSLPFTSPSSPPPLSSVPHAPPLPSLPHPLPSLPPPLPSPPLPSLPLPLPSPSLPCPPFPSPSLPPVPSLPLPLEVGPLKSS